MREDLRSILVATVGLSTAALVSLVLTIMRGPVDPDSVKRYEVVRLFLLGLAVQCLHFVDEFVSGFQARFPLLLDLQGWSDNFFVVLNLTCLSGWILSGIGLQRGFRSALFPVWFFTIVSIANGIAHPLFALLVHGTFGSWIFPGPDQLSCTGNFRSIAVHTAVRVN